MPNDNFIKLIFGVKLLVLGYKCVFFSLSDTIEETNVSKDQKRSVELESNLRSLNSESALGTWQLCQEDP